MPLFVTCRVHAGTKGTVGTIGTIEGPLLLYVEGFRSVLGVKHTGMAGGSGNGGQDAFDAMYVNISQVR